MNVIAKERINNNLKNNYVLESIQAETKILRQVVQLNIYSSLKDE